MLVKEKISLFWGKYPIRVRFMFMGALFILFAPFPIMLGIKTLNFNMRQLEACLFGNQLQRKLFNIQENLALMALDEKKKNGLQHPSSNAAARKEQIEKWLKGVKEEITSFIITPLHPLSYGYSTKPYLPPNFQPIFSGWEKLIHANEQQKESALAALSLTVQTLLIDAGHATGLLLAAKSAPDFISEATIDHLPKILGLSLEHVNHPTESTKERLTQLASQVDREISLALKILRQHYLNVISDGNLHLAQEILKDFISEIEEFQDEAENPLTTHGVLKSALTLFETTLSLNTILSEIQEKLFEYGHQKEELYYYLYLVGVFITGGVFWGLLFIRPISKHLELIVSELHRHAKGDFNDTLLPANHKDEIGQICAACYTLVSAINKLIVQLSGLNEKLKLACSTLSTNLEHHHRDFSRETEGLNLIRSLTKIISTNAEHLEERIQMMTEVSESLASDEKSQEGIILLKNLMKSLNDTAKTVMEHLLFITQNLQVMIRINVNMDKITSHIHLLSLNSAIEASSSNTLKHSFTDTEKNIRRFALKSTGITQQIKHTLEKMLVSSDAAYYDLDRYISKVNANVHNIDQIQRYINNLGENFNKLCTEFNAVNTQMGMQIGKAHSIKRELNQFEEVTNKNKTNITKISTGLTQLSSAAEEMDLLLAKFQLTTRK